MSTNDLIIAISGAGGGTSGPQGFYDYLKPYMANEDISVIQMETIPGNIHDNASRVAETVSRNFDRFRNIYLMGWSMGGAVAILSTYQINIEKQTDTIKGLILLAPQSDGIQLLKELKVPVLFCHGKKDETVPLWTVQGRYDQYQGMKEIVLFEGLDHDFSLNGEKTKFPIQCIAKQITQLFHQNIEPGSHSEVTQETITIPVQSIKIRKTLLERLFHVFTCCAHR
jgi:pimeloyl-ACP methyl ester carboxylesterase